MWQFLFGDRGPVEGPDLDHRRLLPADQRAILDAGLLVALTERSIAYSIAD